MRAKRDYQKAKKELSTLHVHFFFASMFLFFLNTFTFSFTYQPWFLYPMTAFGMILFFKYLEVRKLRKEVERSDRMGLPSGRGRRRLELLEERELTRLYNEQDLI